MRDAAAETPQQIAARYGAAVAPGVAVQQIPRGVSARPLPVWVEGKGLVYPDLVGTCGDNWRRAGNRGGFGNPRTVAAKQARAPHLVELHGQGLSVPQIAEVLGVEQASIRQHLRELGLTPHDGFAVRKAQRLARLRELVAAGHSDRDIADLMDLTVKRLRAWAKDEGVALRIDQPPRKARTVKPGLGRPRRLSDEERKARRVAYARAAYARRIGRDPSEPSRDERAAARRAEVARLHAEGLSSGETAARLGVPAIVVRADRRALRLGPTDADRARRAELNARLAAFNVSSAGPQRRAKVAALREQGLSLSAIARRIGCSSSTVSDDLAILRHEGVMVAAPPPRLACWEVDPTLPARARALRAEGLSLTAIGRALGFPKWTVQRLLNRPVEQPAAPAESDQRAAA